jgi:beta-lactam-binding protein with PASTA domain
MTPRTKKTDVLFYVLLYILLFFAAANVFSQLILRAELINVPDLSGRSLEEARTLLASKKIIVSIQEFRFDGRVERGRIVSQDPAKGSRLKPRRTVRVIVSRGNEQMAVPSVVGRSLEQAVPLLKTSGLRRGRISQIHTPRAAAGRILAQNPPPGDVADKTSTVDILVSRGEAEERFIMPDLIAKNAAVVIRKLKDLEFLKIERSSVYYPDAGSGIIVNQSPIAGSLILKRNQINLEVSR